MDKKELDLRIKISMLVCLIIIASILIFYLVFLPLKNKIYNWQYKKFSECIHNEVREDMKKMNWKIPATSDDWSKHIKEGFEKDDVMLNKCCKASGMQNNENTYRILKDIEIEELKKLNR